MGVWSSYWAERAGRAERVAADLADELENLLRRGYVPYGAMVGVEQALTAHREIIGRREQPLPAGPTAGWR